MNSKTLILIVITFVLLAAGAGGFYFLFGSRTEPEVKSAVALPKDTKPSETQIEYTDPSGFSFNYPDNLSLTNANAGETVDPDAYANLQLFSKDKSGSLIIKITDTKLKTREDWLKENGIPETNIPKEKQLGNLKAWEVKTGDRLMLASIDQGVLFTVESPLIEQEFWGKVYDKVLEGFVFNTPETTSLAQETTIAPVDEIVFEGEEVIE